VLVPVGAAKAVKNRVVVLQTNGACAAKKRLSIVLGSLGAAAAIKTTRVALLCCKGRVLVRQINK